MVNLVDEALRGPLFERPAGFAAADVIVADPAVGTGTFLLGVLRRIAATVAERSGRGRGARRDRGGRQAHHRIRDAVRPVRGGAASADRRIAGADEQAAAARASPVHHRHARQSVHRGGDGSGRPTSRLRSRGAPRTRSRRRSRSPSSSAIRPTRKRRKGAAAGSRRARAESCVAPLDRWAPPPEWGVGAHAKHLKNLYIYFWRWATWKVFGSGNYAATGNPDKDEEGIVCFITVAGFLNGPGFEKMRDDLRRDLLRNLGHRLLAGRPSAGGADAHLPGRAATGLHRACRAQARAKSDERAGAGAVPCLPKGTREEKFAALGQAVASTVPTGSTARPAGAIRSCRPRPAPGRRIPRSRTSLSTTAPASCRAAHGSSRPTRRSLNERWTRLIAEKDPDKEGICLFHPRPRRRQDCLQSRSKDGLVRPR